MQRSLIATALAVAFVAPLAVQAQSAPASSYVKLGVGQARADIDFWGKDTDTAASLSYGVQVNPNFDMEIGYINFGKGNYAPSVGNSLRARSQSAYIAAIGKYPFPQGFSVYGKLGASYHWNKWSGLSSTVAFDDTDRRLAPMVGIGASWQFMPNWAADLDYAYFNTAGKGQGREANIDLWTVGIRYLW